MAQQDVVWRFDMWHSCKGLVVWDPPHLLQKGLSQQDVAYSHVWAWWLGTRFIYCIRVSLGHKSLFEFKSQKMLETYFFNY